MSSGKSIDYIRSSGIASRNRHSIKTRRTGNDKPLKATRYRLLACLLATNQVAPKDRKNQTGSLAEGENTIIDVQLDL